MGGGGGIQKMTLDDRGGEGVWEGPKKDDVIYEQPLNEANNVNTGSYSTKIKVGLTS